MHTPAASSYAPGRPSDAGIEQQQQQRSIISPRSSSSSATSHGHAYAPPPHMSANNMYGSHAAGLALGLGPAAGHPDLRLSVPTSAGAQATSWHQPSPHYSSELAAAGRTWDFGGYVGASPATGLPGSAQSYGYAQRVSSLTGAAAMPSETRFVPLHDYEGHQPTTST